MSAWQRFSRAVGAAEYRVYMNLLRRAGGFREDARLIDGVRVPFFTRGAGPAVLVLHGFGGDKDSWLLLGRLLPKHRRIVIPDFPGFGRAGMIDPSRASARAQAAVVLGLCDALGIGRVDLIGNSMGGGISLRIAHDAPARVRSMTLIGSVGPYVNPSEVFLAIQRGENPLVLRDPEKIDAFLRLVAERVPPAPKMLREYIAHERCARAPVLERLFAGWVSPPAGDGVPDDLESITTPALVIHGERDRVIDVSTGRALGARLPNARLVVLERTGHIPQMERPKRVARLIAGFLDDVSAFDAASGH